MEGKFRKAMVGNAQLDNEKAAAVYQVELYKDRYEELEEDHNQLQVCNIPLNSTLCMLPCLTID